MIVTWGSWTAFSNALSLTVCSWNRVILSYAGLIYTTSVKQSESVRFGHYDLARIGSCYLTYILAYLTPIMEGMGNATWFLNSTD
ncbi:hypothetical protein BGW36DRAFT_157882 [Talaromyces proteolyticus]|uniref:Uncharacterized protein n=1 Tax=Talaromyces proteolyticus TaxID=1131652 RepID=A0AAD4KU01_9EURO|nr:uncharacterized protein BGW36DRAFT_157882 [Talaromyces proteolyticus]KAH8699256.1 hypothetical protein BGW36DRAFT_157882 [Talaromyces proteolyticus]